MLCLKRYKKTLIIALLGFVSFPFLSLAADKTPQKKVVADPDAVAVDINGKKIPYGEFERQLEMFKMQISRGKPAQLPADLLKNLKQQVLDRMIADELLFQQAQKKGLKAEAKAVDGELNKIKSRFKDEKEYLQKLKETGFSEAKLKGQIERRITISSLVEKEIVPTVKVSDEDAKKYYESNVDKFKQPEQIRARHILMKVEKGDSEDKKTASRKKLQAIQKRILAGEDFSKLAKENSQGPTNVKGGDLGYFPKGRMVPAFDEAAFKLALNEVSDIVETQFGYHLIKVIDRKTAGTQPFDKIKPQIKSQLFNEQVQKKIGPYIKSLREKAKVQVHLK